MDKSACGKGLRRVNPTTLSYSTRNDGDDGWGATAAAFWEGIGAENSSGKMPFPPIFALPPKQNGVAQMDERLHQIASISIDLHRQIHAVTQKLGRAIVAVNTTDAERPLKACELLRIHKRIIWCSIVEIDLNTKSLSNTLRETIDSCRINEPRLQWLLNISKFRVVLENALGSAIGICKEIERILKIRSRGEVRGLRINGETVAKVKAIEKEISTKSMNY